ncbi:DNA ligase D [Oxalobacteraceae bacterium]|nr:DNA ligase D [Oxalobacteraceae bacterium]
MTDTLKTYRAKRNFAITPEPVEGGEVGAGGRAFVIQKHWASRLHYDFRLELDGAMKSWAVPKGPSYDSHDKRMAVQVEDHPIAYNDFEGTIPPKQYGAGKVIIWDKGTWQPLGDPRKGYADGNLKFELHGHKLRGKWVLVRMKGRGEKQQPWLLIKEKDEYTRPADEFSVVDEMPDSVKTLAEPAPQAKRKSKPESKLKPARGQAKVALPESLSPQLATLVDKPPSSPEDWLFEIKFDGYRMLARIDGKDIKLFTRNGNDWTGKLAPLQAELARLKLPPGWYDGEIVVNDDKGRPDFGLLQQAFDETGSDSIIYYLFDLPFHDGYDLREHPLEQRRAQLQTLLDKRSSDSVRFSVALDAAPDDIVQAACRMGLEGIIGKRRDGAYVSRRSSDWIKLKCGQRQEFVVGGYTDPQGSRNGLGSLLLGTYDDEGKLHYAGNVGSGFNAAALDDLVGRLRKLASDASPFAPSREIDKKAHWVKPTLVAEVSFGEWTRSGSIRHAVFQGLRADKKAKGIKRERPAHLENAMTSATESATPALRQHGKSGARRGAARAEPPSPEGKLPASLKISNPDRVIDADSGTTKIGLVRYYALVGELMLEHLKNRPVSLVRAPAGVGGELFFQKHADTAKMPGVKQLPVALDPEHPPMLEVSTVPGLLAAAQWNTVELHTQNAFAKTYEKPNRMVFDLDPGKGVEWAQIQEAAQLMQAFLKQLGLPAFLKTSGGKGLHVVVPVKPYYDWDTVKGFSQAIVAHMARTIPERFVLKSGPRNRQGKIFIDYLRNGRGATTVCAWSARARPGLGISVPVGWDELEKLKGGDHWTVHNVHTRLDVGNAPWSDYAGSAVSLTNAMKQLDFQREED